MFNGIIFNKGLITKIIKRPKGINIFVKSDLKLGLKDIGVSIACDGVCLTLISIKKRIMEFYLSNETIKRAKFRYIKLNDRINLELPLKYGQKISGHICQGHVDTVGKILSIKNIDKSYSNIDTIKQFPLKKNKEKVIILSDVANIEFGPVSEKTLFKAQRKNAVNLKTVGIGIYAKSGASTVELSKQIKTKIKELNKSLPDGLKLEIAFNRATYIGAAIEEVYKSLVIAFVLVVLIIYLFLGNLKAVIVPAVALPVSLIGSFLGLYIFDLSINIFVLLSFILAIGIITDDSVIMTDAIYTRIENGETPLVAAYKGSKQITFAIIATTLILIAVFLPLIFIKGISGTLFKKQQ